MHTLECYPNVIRKMCRLFIENARVRLHVFIKLSDDFITVKNCAKGYTYYGAD